MYPVAVPVAQIMIGRLRTVLNELEKIPARRLPPRYQQVSRLIEYYQRGRLVLVLGAGVSSDHGLPSWNTLLQKLLLSTIMREKLETAEMSQVLARIYTELFSPNPLVAARYLYNFYRRSEATDPMAFERAIREAIYEEIKADEEFELLKEIRRLCIAAGKSPNLDSIITYNYDDLLEAYLTKMDIDIQFRSIHAAGMNPGVGELPIYHVHGYLPREGALTENNRVTLSEDFYHRQYNDIYGWSNLVQINKFKDYNCLFIGASFSDPNLRRLLDIAKVQRGDSRVHHYSFRKRYDAKSVEGSLEAYLVQHADVLDEKTKAGLGLGKVAESLVRMVERFEDEDATSFGISTIWVQDFAEIPDILASIRKMGPPQLRPGAPGGIS